MPTTLRSTGESRRHRGTTRRTALRDQHPFAVAAPMLSPRRAAPVACVGIDEIDQQQALCLKRTLHGRYDLSDHHGEFRLGGLPNFAVRKPRSRRQWGGTRNR